MIRWKKYLNPLERHARSLNPCIGLLVLFLTASAGCQNQRAVISREELANNLVSTVRDKYQTRITCRAVGDTLWVYLPYTLGRRGLAGSKEDDKKLYLEYQIASFNPFRTLEPPELRFIVQKLLGEVRGVLLRCTNPYKFFVLVVTDVESRTKIPPFEDWYIGYFNDVRNYQVGADFSGEGYSRLVWHHELIEETDGPDGQKVLKSFRDATGEHVRYHEMTLREFVVKQIEWRVYKRFTIEYNKTPFDLSQQEKEDEVRQIAKTVFLVYNFNEFETVYFRDTSFLDEQKSYTGTSLEDLKKQKITPMRKPAF